MSREKQNNEITEIERMSYEMERLFIEAEIRQTLPQKHPSIIKAEALYNAGYRKQSEGEWIEASNKPYAACGKKCSLCGARISYREYGHGNHKYCHKCGAKMKGGAE